MNSIYLIIPSNMKNHHDLKRVIESIDISRNINVYLINQAADDTFFSDICKLKLCNLIEIKTGGIVPLSVARNYALDELSKKGNLIEYNSFVMFVDDDAWFPIETINYLLSCDIRGFVLNTVDPQNNKSFKKNIGKKGEVKGYHICCDVISICMVIPLTFLLKTNLRFNEKLGLGCEISQGEESLFVYNLHKCGLKIYYDPHLIYHPYKKSFSEKNFYSLSYFWSAASKYVSNCFILPSVKMLFKYTLGLCLIIKDKRYFRLFLMVWQGYFDGKKDLENGNFVAQRDII